MKLSWSHKLFLRINKMLGTRPLLDKIMYFFGQWLIVALALATAIFAFTFLSKEQYVIYFILAAITFLLAYGISYTIAFFFKHPRPVREFPNVKELIIPLKTWKSFPSDHTIAATLFTIFSWYATYSVPIFITMWIAALCVMAGRVYCGVHYPRDIIGGIVVALFSTALVVFGFFIFIFFAFGSPFIMN